MLLLHHNIEIAFSRNTHYWLSDIYTKRKILAIFRTKIIFGEKNRKDSQVKYEKPLPTLRGGKESPSLPSPQEREKVTGIMRGVMGFMDL